MGSTIFGSAVGVAGTAVFVGVASGGALTVAGAFWVGGSEG